MVRTVVLVALAMLAFAANSIFARLALGSAEIDAAGYTGVRMLAGAVTLALLLLSQRRPLAIGEASALILGGIAVALTARRKPA